MFRPNPCFFLWLLFALGCTDKKVSQVIANHPNVLLIMTDDQGYGDLGFTGNHLIHTPNLDQFAKESTWFTNFYVSPVCAPTRASLMTGKFALSTGIYDTFNGGAMMDTNETTLAEILKENGYETAIFGKWHLGDTYPFRPSDQGFTESFIHHGGGIGQYGDPENYFAKDTAYFNPVLYHNNKKVKTKGYCSDVFTDGLIDFIKNEKDKPFFAYMAFNAPHDPLQVPEFWYNKYKDLRFDQAEAKKYGMPHINMTDWEKENARRVYAMVENIDYNVGRILESLRKKGELSNTLIIFLSDNGPMSKRYNVNLRALKSSTYQGGVKSPLLMHYPGRIKKNRKIGTVAAHIDLLPTIVDFCRLPLPKNSSIDGRSMLPLLEGKEQASFMNRNIYEQWDRMFPERYQNMSVRKGNYKLVVHADYNAPLKAFELYDTENDPSEEHNIAQDRPKLVKQLKSELDSWFEKEVIEEGNPKRQYNILDPEKEASLVLTRNDAKGTPEIWGNDMQYGCWDVDVKEAGKYNVTLRFKEKATKVGRMYLKQSPLQYSLPNDAVEATQLGMENIYLKAGKWPIEVFYKTGWNEIMLPLTVTIKKAP